MLEKISQIISLCINRPGKQAFPVPALNLDHFPNEIIVQIFEQTDLFYQDYRISMVCRRFYECVHIALDRKLFLEKVKYLEIFKRTLMSRRITLSFQLFNHFTMKNQLGEQEMINIIAEQGQLVILKQLTEPASLNHKGWNKEICHQALRRAAISGQLNTTQYLLEKYFEEFQRKWTEDEGPILFETIKNKKTSVAKFLLEDPRINPLTNQGASFILVCQQGELALLNQFFKRFSVDLRPYRETAILRAVWYNQQAIVKELLQNHYFQFSKISKGTIKQAIFCAQELKHYAIVNYISKIYINDRKRLIDSELLRSK